jgi:hypothetical protein
MIVTPELAGAPFTVAVHDLQPVTPAVVLENPRDARDVAEVIYAASCYGIAQVWLSGGRVGLDPFGPPARQREARGWEPVVVVPDPDPLAHFTIPTVVVAVERGQPGAFRLGAIGHPQQVVYVFGPEDGDLSAATLQRADWVVEVPARHSLYLAGAVWVTLATRAIQLGLPDDRTLCLEVES